jgi:hypothetical protein
MEMPWPSITRLSHGAIPKSGTPSLYTQKYN